MDTQTIHQRYISLLASFGIPLQIQAVRDPDLPQQEILQEGEQFILRLNCGKHLPDVPYESYVACGVRQLLLPRLVLETPRLVLRRFRKEDAAACFSFLSDRQTCYHDGGYEPYSEMDENYFRLMETFEKQETRYLITLKSTGEVIGTIHLWEDNSRAVDAMEIGYVIAPNHRRKGHAFEAASAIVHLLQDELRLDMMLGGAFADNTASLQLLKKLGFVQEGILHRALWHAKYGPVDIVHFYRDR